MIAAPEKNPLPNRNCGFRLSECDSERELVRQRRRRLEA
jgi:hypothetical protein